MFGLRSLRNRLAVVFGLIVLGAIGTIYLTVTPRLEERLRNQKVERLLADAKSRVEGRNGFAVQYGLVPTRDKKPLRARDVSAAAVSASAEVLIFDRLNDPDGLVDVMDSVPDGGLDGDDARSLAIDAMRTRRAVSSTEGIRGGRYAIVAYP